MVLETNVKKILHYKTGMPPTYPARGLTPTICAIKDNYTGAGTQPLPADFISLQILVP